jgi:hypothetical protein
MDAQVQEQETSTSTPVEAAQAAPATEATPVAPEAAVSTPPIQEYVPNLKYKFDDQEKEVDEFWKPLIKDEVSNKKVLEALQMMDAFPKYKEKATQYGEVNSAVEQLSKWFASGDHDRVLETLGYTDDMLKDIMIAKLQREKLPAEQRQIFEEKRRVQLENERLLADNQKYQMDVQRELERRTDFELDTELGKAEYRKLVDVYERTHGSGSFKRKVAQVGEAMVRQAGTHVPPAEVMKVVVRDYQPFLQMEAPQTSQAPKVIPQVGSGSGSPGKKAVTSLDDLKRRRAELELED